MVTGDCGNIMAHRSALRPITCCRKLGRFGSCSLAVVIMNGVYLHSPHVVCLPRCSFSSRRIVGLFLCRAIIRSDSRSWERPGRMASDPEPI
jgi:hypothetical protein